MFQNMSRIAADNRIGFCVFRNNCASSNNCVFTYSYTGQNHGLCPDPCVFLDGDFAAEQHLMVIEVMVCCQQACPGPIITSSSISIPPRAMIVKL